MQLIDYIVKARSILNIRKDEIPNHPPYLEVEAQLNYIEDVLTGKEKDKSKLYKLTLGIYAGKEYDVSDPELANSLSDVNYIASQIAKGLKVQQP